MKNNNEKNIFKNMEYTFHDEYDLDNVKKLFCLKDSDLLKLTNYREYTDEENENYIKMIRKSLYNIIIENKSKKQIHYKIKDCNRLYSIDGNTLQYFSNTLLSYVLPKNCFEIDMKNSNPMILLYLCKKHDLNHKHLEYYCNNRDNLLKEYKLDKSFILKLFNKDTFKKSDIQWLDDLIVELNKNKKIIIQKECDLLDPNYIKMKENSYNCISSLTCAIIWFYECDILLKATKLCKCIIPKYDGLITNSENINIDDFNNLTKEYDITWSIKKFNQEHLDYDLNQNILNQKLEQYFYKDFKLYDISDTYYICEKFNKYISKTIKYCKDLWYVLDTSDNLWKIVKEPQPYILKILRIGLTNQKNALEIALEKEKDRNDDVKDKDYIKRLEQKIELQKSYFSKIDKASFCNQFKKNITQFITDNNFYKTLDNESYTIAYKNGIYNIITKQFNQGIYPGNYLTTTLDFEYTEKINQDDLDFIHKEFLKIMNCNQEHYDYLMSVLGYAFSNNSTKYQEFYFCIGQLAGNGKSAIFESLKDCFDCYVGNVDSKLLESDYNKKHKLIPSLEKYRLVYLNEMKQGKKIDSQMIKLIADGCKMDNEEMFGTTQDINVKSKCFLLSNFMPDFDKLEQGSYRRYKHIQYDSSFRPEFKHDDYENKKFISDPDFKKKLFNKRQALLFIILDYANKVYHNGMPDMPESFNDEKEIVKDTNMEVKEYLENNIEITNNNQNKISKQEIIDKFKDDTSKVLNQKNLMDIMRQLGHHKKYDKNAMKNYNRGCYRGMKLISNLDKNDPDNLDSDSD